ncbi:Zinc-regulated transporter 2 [Cyphellophora attinorum]|uniref:Zinc-regulated transporter 2 n=1 Tax=Cyphellophora attinorum TaxID=1664694 RepID=A0A0N1P332_9EURO|nr:Zinc-regulated transporter 2 [Phialophora attinorum]KPI43407.1 Zinc-regulated transporter 2 [Phialophora attinorum]
MSGEAPADPLADAKPVCGGEGFNPEDYDFPLHLAAVFIVFLASIAGAGFPVVAKKVKWMKIPPKLFFFTKHFGTGVLIATAFVHLVPTAFASLSDPCLPDVLIEDYPAMPGVIMMFSVFCLFVIEMYLKSKVGGHSHGGPTGQEISKPLEISGPLQQKRGHGPAELYRNDTASSLPPYDRGRDQFMDSYQEKLMARLNVAHEEQPEIEKYAAVSEMLHGSRSSTHNTCVNSYLHLDEEDPYTVDPAKFRIMNLNITLLEGGILFHSVFVGMTISITTDGFITLLVAIIFHQFFEGLGLGSRIAAVPYKPKALKPWVLVVAFGTTCPIGQIIGLVTRDSYDQGSAFSLILVGFFNAFSSGLLIYAALVDLLAEDFLSEEAQELMDKSMKIKAFIYVLLGAAGMAVVGAFA